MDGKYRHQHNGTNIPSGRGNINDATNRCIGHSLGANRCASLAGRTACWSASSNCRNRRDPSGVQERRHQRQVGRQRCVYRSVEPAVRQRAHYLLPIHQCYGVSHPYQHADIYLLPDVPCLVYTSGVHGVQRVQQQCGSHANECRRQSLRQCRGHNPSNINRAISLPEIPQRQLQTSRTTPNKLESGSSLGIWLFD